MQGANDTPINPREIYIGRCRYHIEPFVNYTIAAAAVLLPQQCVQGDC